MKKYQFNNPLQPKMNPCGAFAKSFHFIDRTVDVTQLNSADLKKYVTFKFSWLINVTKHIMAFRTKNENNLITCITLLSKSIDCMKKNLKHISFYQNQYSINEKNI